MLSVEFLRQRDTMRSHAIDQIKSRMSDSSRHSFREETSANALRRSGCAPHGRKGAERTRSGHADMERLSSEMGKGLSISCEEPYANDHRSPNCGSMRKTSGAKIGSNSTLETSTFR